MAIKRIVFCLTISVVGIGLLTAKDPWDQQPPEKWSRAQVTALFNNSPWAQQQDYSSPLAGDSTLGQNEIHNYFTVRLFSALPIREAYYRILQIMNHYEEMPEQQQKDFEAHAGGIVHADVHDEVVISVAYNSNDQTHQRDMKHFLDTQTTATFNQSAYLYSPRLGRLDLVKYVPAANEGIGARFIYPRTVNGQPIIQPGDKDLRFEFWAAPLNQKVMFGFKTSKLMYKGELAY